MHLDEGDSRARGGSGATREERGVQAISGNFEASEEISGFFAGSQAISRGPKEEPPVLAGELSGNLGVLHLSDRRADIEGSNGNVAMNAWLPHEISVLIQLTF